MTKAKKFGEYIAEVTGESTSSEKVNFKLRLQEIKHIRRVIYVYDRIFARAYDNKDLVNLNKRIAGKFSKFGRIKRRLSPKQKKKILREHEKICSFKGCEERDNLTLDHIERLNNFENASDKNNFQLLCPKHHLLKELKSHLFHKELEIKKVSQRIEDIEKRGTTDCLGYQVLSKNKFIEPEENSH